MFIFSKSIPDPQTTGMRDTIYVLTLNPMRGKAEELRIIGYAHTEEEIYEMLEAAKADAPYITLSSPEMFDNADCKWHHVFKEDSGLMWMNCYGEVHMMRLTNAYNVENSTAIYN